MNKLAGNIFHCLWQLIQDVGDVGIWRGHFLLSYLVHCVSSPVNRRRFCGGGQVILTPGTGQIIERMAWRDWADNVVPYATYH